MSDVDNLTVASQALISVNTESIVVAIFMAGASSMALLELVKDLTPIRRYLQRRWIRKWIDSSSPSGGKDKLSSQEIEIRMIELATGGDQKAFYALPIEQLLAQLNSAVQAVMDSPDRYRLLVMTLGHGADRNDIDQVNQYTREGTTSDSNVKKARHSVQFVLDARNRVGQRMQRNLDALQISMTIKWRSILQIACLGLSVIFIESFVSSLPQPHAGTYLVGFFVGVLGGYIGPVLRDVLESLQSMRR